MPQGDRIAMRHTTRTRSLRTGLLASAVATGIASAVIAASPGVLAEDICTITGNTAVCAEAGTQSLDVPDGTESIEVTVIGGGGGRGDAEVENVSILSPGGSGAEVDANLDVTSGSLTVYVATGGRERADGYLAHGGGMSRLATADGTTLVIAGGGGGGAGSGRTGGDGATGGSAFGGNGNGNFGEIGGGGNRGNGGFAGYCCGGGNYAAGAGQDFDLDSGTGGAGGRAGQTGAYGGAGYGGGGGGTGNSAAGAGGSYINDDYVLDEATFQTTTGSAGAGGSTGLGGWTGAAGADGYVLIRFIINIPSSTPNAGGELTTRTINVNFGLNDKISCNFDAIAASLGSWIQLPAASDCSITPRAGGEEPSLLGWATQEDFPAAIAQRQVDNGWGAYETFNDDGRLTGVFIPSGGYTTVSNDTNLYPIWSE